MLPYATIGRVDCACPVIQFTVTNDVRNRALNHKGRKRWYFGWEIFVGRSLTANGTDGQNKIPYFGALLEATTFAEEYDCLGHDGRQQIRNCRSIGRTHAKIDDGNVIVRGDLHGLANTLNGDAALVSKALDVI